MRMCHVRTTATVFNGGAHTTVIVTVQATLDPAVTKVSNTMGGFRSSLRSPFLRIL